MVLTYWWWWCLHAKTIKRIFLLLTCLEYKIAALQLLRWGLNIIWVLGINACLPDAKRMLFAPIEVWATWNQWREEEAWIISSIVFWWKSFCKNVDREGEILHGKHPTLLCSVLSPKVLKHRLCKLNRKRKKTPMNTFCEGSWEDISPSFVGTVLFLILYWALSLTLFPSFFRFFIQLVPVRVKILVFSLQLIIP